MEKVLICFAAALAIGLCAIATGWAQSKIGAAGAGTICRYAHSSRVGVSSRSIPDGLRADDESK